MNRVVLDGMLGFTGGVMVAASFWSLLAPAIEMSSGGGFVKVNVSPFGMPTGSYPYTFTTRSPSGIFQSNTNVVALTINDNPYTGALLYPQSGAGSEMRVVQQLSEEGEYTFNFNINGLVKEVQVVVMPSPQLKLLAASINDESISSFNSIYYVNHAASDRFVELSLQAVNVKDTFSYVVSSTGEFPSGEALNAAKNPLVIVEGGKTSIGVTLPARNINNLTTPEQNTYIITLYDGNKEKLISIINPLLGKPSVLDPSHIEEGIVLRIEDENGVRS
jgi:hypothetical protein